MKKSPIILLLLLTISFVTGCEKEVFDISPTIEAYYVESVKLPSVTIDSVESFSNKVDGFTRNYPEAIEQKHTGTDPVCKRNETNNLNN